MLDFYDNFLRYAKMPHFLVALRLRAFSVLFFEEMSNNLFGTAGILKSTERCLEPFLFSVKDHS